MYKHLTKEQRYTISKGLQKGKSIKEIAEEVEVSVSTIYREIKRNGKRRKNKIYYSPQNAHMYYLIRKCENASHTTITTNTYNRVMFLLTKEKWSPEQISNYLKINEQTYISHETIYKIIRKDMSNGGILWTFCHHKMRYKHKPSYIRKHHSGVKHIPNRTSIHDRPDEVGKRFGDFELDTIIGVNKKSYIITICEKSTNYLIISKIDNLRPENVANKVIDMLIPYKSIIKSITTDNGFEFRDHELIAKRLNTTVYFTDPYSSWQKGAIENTNKLIRFFIPKKSDFNTFSDDDILQIQYILNRRPRKKLNFNKPKDLFFKNL